MYSPYDKYVDYIRFRQQQATQKMATSGMTTWAILAALVYIFWETIPIATMQETLPTPKFTVWSCLIGCSISSSIRDIYISLNNHSNPNSSYKIKSNNEWEARREMIMLLLAMIPFVLCAPAWWFFGGEIKFNIYHVNSALSLMVIIPLFNNYYNEKAKKKKHELPSIESITGANEKTGFTATLIAYALWFSLIYFNAIELISINQNPNKEAIKFIFNIAVIYSLLIILIENKTNSWELRYLEDLDRDIVMQDLTEEDIKIRFQSEYFGFQFGDWAKNMVSKTSLLIAECRELETLVSDEVSKISEIPSQYKHEKRVRIQKLSDMTKGKIEETEKIINSLHDWSQKLINTLTSNSSIYGDAKDLNLLSEKNKNETNELLNRIRMSIQNIS